MKTSNKFIILAGVVLVALLVSYDLALKAEYETGRYKDPFHNYAELPYKNFDKVSVLAANEMDVEIRQSDTFSVRVSGQIKDRIDIKQERSELILRAKQGDRWYLGDKRGVVIYMPRLKEVSASEFVRVVGEGRTEISGHGDNDILISGFNLDALKLNLITNSVIILEKNKIENLHAVVDGTSFESQLQIDQSDKIKNANITVTGKNSLKLINPDIANLNHNLSDSALLVLQGGKAMKLISR